VPAASKKDRIRATSGVLPVNNAKACAAWWTAISLPDIARQPIRLAQLSRSVSIVK